jgi:NTP pyrophosphatase (non-canonical NTP hydrolase)
MDFNELRRANVRRQKEWDPDNRITTLFVSNELAGETGEACNVVKKLERMRLGLRGSTDTVAHLAEELADVVICADLLAAKEGIDLEQAIIDKFDATSAKLGLKIKLKKLPNPFDGA